MTDAEKAWEMAKFDIPDAAWSKVANAEGGEIANALRATFMRGFRDGQALARPEESVVKDAARYRFLRDNPWFQIEYTGELTLDQHIDAEMENKP